MGRAPQASEAHQTHQVPCCEALAGPDSRGNIASTNVRISCRSLCRRRVPGTAMPVPAAVTLASGVSPEEVQ
jgi:hypothetical protein